MTISIASPVSIQDLKLYKTHRERYLLCKALGGATGLLEATLPVVDPAGDTLQLKTFSYPLVPITLGSPILDDYDAVFPTGTILAIKQPRITRCSNDQDQACIRVDCPHDIVILDQKSLASLIADEDGALRFTPIPRREKNLMAWKDEGNGVSRARYCRHAREGHREC
jgi:hypothetical protein